MITKLLPGAENHTELGCTGMLLWHFLQFSCPAYAFLSHCLFSEFKEPLAKVQPGNMLRERGPSKVVRGSWTEWMIHYCIICFWKKALNKTLGAAGFVHPVLIPKVKCCVFPLASCSHWISFRLLDSLVSGIFLYVCIHCVRSPWVINASLLGMQVEFNRKVFKCIDQFYSKLSRGPVDAINRNDILEFISMLLWRPQFGTCV